MTAPVNVAEHLARRAAEAPHRPAVYVPTRRGYVALTFSELNARADALAHGFNRIGIRRGVRTVLMIPPSAEFFAATFALLKVAAVPVFIDPGMGVRTLGKCLSDAGPEAFVGVAKAHVARRLLGWGTQSVRITVNTGRRRFLSRYCFTDFTDHGPYPSPAVEASDPAAVLFTSGSTGPAKGAAYTHGIFAAQVELLKSVYGIEPGEVDLCTFPLFALFGPALGMSCVVPEMNPSKPATIDPAKAVAAAERFGVTNLFGSPAVIRRLAEYGRALPTLKRAISAGAPADVRVLGRFAPLLPAGVQLFTPYGATEALPVANVGSSEILGETAALTAAGKGVCIGRPVPGIDVRILRIGDDPIPEWDDSLVLPAGEVGEITVRGPVVTREYVNRPEHTAKAKIHDPQTGAVWHRMGDLGYFDDRGRLWFCGRKSHRVGGLFTDQVEPVFHGVPGVTRVALVGVRGKPVICTEVLRTTPSWVQLAGQLRARAAMFPHTAGIQHFLPHPGEFPVDVRHNSKIFREKLAAWAARRLPGPT